MSVHKRRNHDEIREMIKSGHIAKHCREAHCLIGHFNCPLTASGIKCERVTPENWQHFFHIYETKDKLWKLKNAASTESGTYDNAGADEYLELFAAKFAGIMLELCEHGCQMTSLKQICPRNFKSGSCNMRNGELWERLFLSWFVFYDEFLPRFRSPEFNGAAGLPDRLQPVLDLYLNAFPDTMVCCN